MLSTRHSMTIFRFAVALVHLLQTDSVRRAQILETLRAAQHEFEGNTAQNYPSGTWPTQSSMVSVGSLLSKYIRTAVTSIRSPGQFAAERKNHCADL